MPHDFSIDKKTGIILLTSCGLVGLLLLVAGFLLGIQYRFSSSSAKLKAQHSSAKVKQAPVDLPTTKPVPQLSQASIAQGNSAQPLIPRTSLSRQTPASTNTGKTAKNSFSVKAHNPSEVAIQSPPSHPAAGSQKPTSPPTAEAARQPAQVAAASPAALFTNRGRYSIQIGAFLNPKNAEHLLKALKEKGCKARIFVATGAKFQVWHTVRIGFYKSIEAASLAARRFRQAEHLLAIVRPADSL